MDQQFLNDLNQLSQQQPQEQIQPIQKSTLLIDSNFTSFIHQIQTRTFNLQQYSQALDQYIIKANEYVSLLDKEIVSFHRYMAQVMHLYFSELDSIIKVPQEYCELAYLICKGWKQNSKINLSNAISPQQKISLEVSLSNCKNYPSQIVFNKIQQIHSQVSQIIQFKNILMAFVEKTLHLIAPNLARLVGTNYAAKLIALAGGLKSLSRMPASNIQLIGNVKNANLGFGLLSRNHGGLFYQMDIVKKADHKMQVPLIRMLSTNASKCAKVDYLKTCSNGYIGETFRKQMMLRYEKINELSQPRKQKLQPIPDQQPKKRRGGKRARRLRQLYQKTEIQKYLNRIKFGTEAQGEYGEVGIGIGMLNKIGKIRVGVNKKKLMPSKKLMDRLKKSEGRNGTITNLQLTPAEGMQIMNPGISEVKRVQTYFNPEAGFTTVIQNKKAKLQ